MQPAKISRKPDRGKQYAQSDEDPSSRRTLRRKGPKKNESDSQIRESPERVAQGRRLAETRRIAEGRRKSMATNALKKMRDAISKKQSADEFH